MKTLKKLTTLTLCLFLTAAMMLTAVGCGSKDAGTKDGQITDGSVLGEGDKSFVLEVVDTNEKTISVTIKTSAATVGEALLATGVAQGEDSDFGLFITTVCGETLDYDADGMYWAFYINGEFAMTPVDQTDVEDGAVYKLAAEKA